MKALKITLVVALVLVALASCTTFKASGLSYTTDAPKYSVLGQFDISVPVTEFLGSAGGAKLGNITSDATEPAIKAAIEKEIKAKGGSAAINVTIIHQASLIDIILNGITGSIYAPCHVLITGTIVK